MQIEKIPYGGWPNCYRLTNGNIEAIVTTDIGPRIIRFGFVDGDNIFKEYPEMFGQQGGDTWNIYGGHRLWLAPEVTRRTYYPDNAPVSLQQHDGFVRLVSPVEDTTGIQKEFDLKISETDAQVEVVHRLRNHNLWAVELSPWALSVMDSGGVAIVPLPPNVAHNEDVLPATSITLWGYSNLADARLSWGQRYVLVRQDPAATTPQKIGFSVTRGWLAYAHPAGLFVKRFPHNPNATYPDFGASVEVFTNPAMLELETLGPLVSLAPDAIVEHTEHWQLFPPVTLPQTEDDVDLIIKHNFDR